MIMEKNMKKGTNIALLNEKARYIYEHKVMNNIERNDCVFISHRSNDSEIARSIAQDIKNAGADVYIDLDDDGLQLASIKDDAASIVNYIEKAILMCSQILVIVSDDTKESWWVPYEVGYAKKSQKEIISCIVGGEVNVDFPDYLKIERTLNNKNEFIDYVQEIRKKGKQHSRYGSLFENAVDNDINKCPSAKYIRDISR